MPNLCNAFRSEHQAEYTTKKLQRTLPIKPPLTWKTSSPQELVTVDPQRAEELLEKFARERYRTNSQLSYDDKTPEKREAEEEYNAGKELVIYIKKIYFEAQPLNQLRQPYSATRILGYSGPDTLRCHLSSYQDSHGRAGGQVILDNLNKVMIARHRMIEHAKLQANVPDS